MSDRSHTRIPSEDIVLTLIDDSPYQRRREYDPEKLQELADMIKEHGQLTDALVRPMEGGRFELVAGHRRKRACAMVGLASLECKVRPMSDDDARELVMIEQLQNENWKPSEEAEGYRDLLALRDDQGKPRHTIATLASRIGKKESHIRELVAMLDTPLEMRTAVDEGRVSKRSAQIVAGEPDPERRKLFARMVLHPADKTSPLTTSETIVIGQRDFYRSLQGAPFKTKDADLLPSAGSCDKCEFRTGNVAAFKGLIQSNDGTGGTAGIAPNLCTKPSCFKLKCEAVAEKVKAEAKGRGCELMPDDEAKRLFDKDGVLRDNVDYVDRNGKPDSTLCHHFDDSKMPTWKKLIQTTGKGTVQAWLAKNPVTGEFVELIKWQDAVKCVNDGCRELGDELFFKGGEKAETQSTAGSAGSTSGQGSTGQSVFSLADETIKPGDNIMLPEKKDDPLWDPAEAKRTAQEARDKKKKDEARLCAVLEQMHEKLPVVLAGDGRDAAVYLFAEQMLQLVGCEEVIVEMAHFYGLTDGQDNIDDSELLGLLMNMFDEMSPFERSGFIIMIMIRRVAIRFGHQCETVIDWCTQLGIEDEEESDEQPTLHACDACSRKITVAPERQTERLKCEAGEFTCIHCGGTWEPIPDEAQPMEVRAALGLVAPVNDVDEPDWMKEAKAVAAGEPVPQYTDADALPPAGKQPKAKKQASGKPVRKQPAAKPAKKASASKAKPVKASKASVSKKVKAKKSK
jgi:ParB/RepB/Spo0J family partition protein